MMDLVSREGVTRTWSSRGQCASKGTPGPFGASVSPGGLVPNGTNTHTHIQTILVAKLGVMYSLVHKLQYLKVLE